MFLPTFKWAANESRIAFCPVFLEITILARPVFDLQFNDEEMSIEPPPKKRFASVDEAAVAVLDKKRTPHATRRTMEK